LFINKEARKNSYVLCHAESIRLRLRLRSGQAYFRIYVTTDAETSSRDIILRQKFQD